MDPDSIELSSIGKMFEYEKLAREVNECNDLSTLKDITKSYIKLYFKQQEVVSNLGLK
jgi:hypothetical protein|tara:strand:+ start:365 stop:538 length:174 start_codon:yes stop_codon:yes gene_type:complete